MSIRFAKSIALVLAAAAAAAVVIAGGDSPYRTTLVLDSANGLREGSLVKVGGAEVGRIGQLGIEADDQVIARLELDRDAIRVTRRTRARVVTSNLLGSKYVELDPGRGGEELPSGSTIRRVSYPVDLDQVLGVLDAETRVRLTMHVNEMGTAMAGRREDFAAVLELVPPDLERATEVLDRVVADNHSLGDAVAHSSRFVSELAGERQDLTRLVDEAGTAMEAVADRREELRGTLAEAPATMRSLRRFLADLEQTTTPLGPAASALRQSAAPLRELLAELPGFRSAAQPALERAINVAPLLTRLGDRATPVARRALPVLEDLSDIAGRMEPVTEGLDRSVDDALAVLEGWARSIQDRDGAGHFFRGFATISPDVMRNAVDRLLPAPAARDAERPSRRSRFRRAQPEGQQRQEPAALDVTPPRSPLLDLPGAGVEMPELDGLLPESEDGGRARDEQLLDFLLAP